MKIMNAPALSRFLTVWWAEPVPDQQTGRLLSAVEDLGINVDSLFVNRVLMESGKCRRCARAQQWQRATLGKLGKKYPRYPIYMLRELPGEIAGAAALRKFTRALWGLG